MSQSWQSPCECVHVCGLMLSWSWSRLICCRITSIYWTRCVSKFLSEIWWTTNCHAGRAKPPAKTTSAVAKHAPALPGTQTPIRVPQSATTATRGAGVSTCADVVCDLCCANLRKNEENTIQCEGACGMWYHWYCIGVSRSQSEICRQRHSICFPLLLYLCPCKLPE